MPVLVDGASIGAKKPLDGFSLTTVTGTCGRIAATKRPRGFPDHIPAMIALANVHHAALSGIHVSVTDFEGPLLGTYNVTGTGLTGAAELAEAARPKATDAIQPAATPYALH